MVVVPKSNGLSVRQNDKVNKVKKFKLEKYGKYFIVCLDHIFNFNYIMKIRLQKSLNDGIYVNILYLRDKLIKFDLQKDEIDILDYNEIITT